MKRLSLITLCSLILLVPACGWWQNRRRCCAPTAVCSTAECAPGTPCAEGQPCADGQCAPVQVAPVAQVEGQATAAPSVQPAEADYDFDADEDDKTGLTEEEGK